MCKHIGEWQWHDDGDLLEYERLYRITDIKAAECAKCADKYLAGTAHWKKNRKKKKDVWGRKWMPCWGYGYGLVGHHMEWKKYLIIYWPLIFENSCAILMILCSPRHCRIDKTRLYSSIVNWSVVYIYSHCNMQSEKIKPWYRFAIGLAIHSCWLHFFFTPASSVLYGAKLDHRSLVQAAR